MIQLVVDAEEAAIRKLPVFNIVLRLNRRSPGLPWRFERYLDSILWGEPYLQLIFGQVADPVAHHNPFNIGDQPRAGNLAARVNPPHYVTGVALELGPFLTGIAGGNADAAAGRGHCRI